MLYLIHCFLNLGTWYECPLLSEAIEVNNELSFGLKTDNFLGKVKKWNIWYCSWMKTTRSVFSCLIMRHNVTFKMPSKPNILLTYRANKTQKTILLCGYKWNLNQPSVASGGRIDIFYRYFTDFWGIVLFLTKWWLKHQFLGFS